MTAGDRGSTIPLILGFVIVGLLTTAAAVAAGDAFVQQRGLQALCDGAATAAAASALDLGRDVAIEGSSARFAEVPQAVDGYLSRDGDRRDVHVEAAVSTDGRTLSLTCTEQRTIAFGAVFGKAAGVRHVAHSSAQSPLRLG